jgi:hypothetical protein
MAHPIGYFTSSPAARFVEAQFGSCLERLDWNGKLELALLLGHWVYREDEKLSLYDAWMNLIDVDPEGNGPIDGVVGDIPNLGTLFDGEALLEACIHLLRYGPKSA